MHSSSPYINFLLYPSAYPFEGNSGVCLFFLKRWNGTTAVSEARDTRSVGARGAATRHERVPPIDPPVVFRRWRRRERKGKWPTDSFPLSWPSRAHTHIPAAKNFSHSTCTTRLSCKRKNSLASTFPTDLWQTLFVHFFLSLFFFFFFRTPDSRNIGFSPSDYSREFRQIYLDPRFGI